MQKKQILLGLTCLLATGAIAGVTLAVGSGAHLNQVKGAEEDYTLIVTGKDFTSSTSPTSGSAYFVTESTKEEAPANQNKVKFNFESGSHYEEDEIEYLSLAQYGTGRVYNDATSAIRNLISLEYTGYGNILIEWGWYDSDLEQVKYESSEVISGGMSYFNYDHPNYVRISSTNYSAPIIEKLTFTYDKSCEATENPYLVSGGLRYRTYPDLGVASVLGFADASVADLVIPATVSGFTVTDIGEEAFVDNDVIETVSFPNGLEYIRSRAFDGCSNITSLTFPNTILGIGFCSFRGLTSCGSVTFEAGGTELLSFGQSAFDSVAHSGVLTLPSRVDSFASETFEGAESVTAFALNDDNVAGNVASVVDGVLYSQEYSTKYLEAYPLAKSATSFTIPSDVTEVRTGSGLSGAKNLVTLNVAPADGVQLLFNSYCAAYLDNLEHLNFGGDGTIKLYWYCFRFAPKLKDVVIPNNVIVKSAGFGQVNDDTLNPLKLHLVADKIPDSWDNDWDYNNEVDAGYITVDFNYVA